MKKETFKKKKKTLVKKLAFAVGLIVIFCLVSYSVANVLIYNENLIQLRRRMLQ